MRFLIVVFLAAVYLQGIAAEKESEDAAKIEMILRQQRELEANELVLAGKKHQKEGRFEEAVKNYSKAISLYEKSSASEKRIIAKINDSRIRLVSSYKSLADEVIKQAEKASSVEMFEKAEKLLAEAKKISNKIKLRR